VILPVLADPSVPDELVGGRLRDQIGMQRLREITAGSWKPLPKDHGRLSELDSSYSYLRQFTPNVLAAIDFQQRLHESGVPVADRPALPPPGRAAAGEDAVAAALRVRLGEANVSASVIMAKTGHKSLRSVQRYVKPGLAAVHAATETLSGPRRRG